MAVKRDYGSFSRACERLFAPMVAPLGFVPFKGVTFIRPRGEWNDTLILQQSQWGGGEFCVNAGIWVPALGRMWGHEDAAPGLSISGRLGPDGVDAADCWKPARDKAELAASLEAFAGYLDGAQPWFARFDSMVAVARGYRATTWLGEEPGQTDPMHERMAASYGFLLMLAGRREEAVGWLRDAERLMVATIEPTAEDARRLSAVRGALGELGCEVAAAPSLPAAEARTKTAPKPKAPKPKFPSDPQRHAEAYLLGEGFGKIGPKAYLRVRDGVVGHVSFQGVKKDLHAWFQFAPLDLPEFNVGMGFAGASGRFPAKDEPTVDAVDEASFDAAARELAACIERELPRKAEAFGTLEGLAQNAQRPFGRAFACLALGRFDDARRFLDVVSATSPMEAERCAPFRTADNDALKGLVAREIHRNVVRYGMHKLPGAQAHLTVPLLAGWPGDWKTWT